MSSNMFEYSVCPVLVKKSVVESFVCPVPTNESMGELSTCPVSINGFDFEWSDGPLSSNVFEVSFCSIAINEHVICPLSPVMIPETLSELLTLSVMSPETVNTFHVCPVTPVISKGPTNELSIYPVSVKKSTFGCKLGTTGLAYEGLYCFKSDADWSAQIEHIMCSVESAPMLLQLIH